MDFAPLPRRGIHHGSVQSYQFTNVFGVEEFNFIVHQIHQFVKFSKSIHKSTFARMKWLDHCYTGNFLVLSITPHQKFKMTARNKTFLNFFLVELGSCSRTWSSSQPSPSRINISFQSGIHLGWKNKKHKIWRKETLSNFFLLFCSHSTCFLLEILVHKMITWF